MLVESVGEVAVSRMIERGYWLPLGIDPVVRQLTVATVLQKLNTKSDRLKKALRSNATSTRPKEVVWDTVFIGAGVHTSAIANSIAGAYGESEAPSMLVVEAGRTVAANFEGLGDTIARNSSSRAGRKGAAVRRGGGDKNPNGFGPWTDPDLSGNEYPGVGLIADTAAVNLFTADTDVLMESFYSGYDERGPGDNWPAKFRINIKTKEGDLVVYTDTLIRSRGFGAPTVKGVDEATLRLFKAERAEIDFAKPETVPGIVHAADALKLGARSPTGRDPYRNAAKRNTPEQRALTKRNIKARKALAAFFKFVDSDLRDGEYTAQDSERYAAISDAGFEALAGLGYSPEELKDLYAPIAAVDEATELTVATTTRALQEATKQVRARLDRLAEAKVKTLVVGAGDSGRTFLEYLFGRSPAAAYGGNGKMDTAQRGEIGDLDWAVGTNGPADCEDFIAKTRSRYLGLAGLVRETDDTAARVPIRRAKVTSVRKVRSQYEVTFTGADGATSSEIYDRVVFATGYEGLTDDAEVRVPLKAKVENLAGERTVAKQVRGKRIYDVGPEANGADGDLPEGEELFGTRENVASIYAFLPRDEAFVTEVYKQAQPRRVSNPSFVKRDKALTLVEGASSNNTITRAAAADIVSRGRGLQTPLVALAIQSEMRDAMEGVLLPFDAGTMTITVTQGAAGLEFTATLRDSAVNIGPLVKRLREDHPLLIEQLMVSAPTPGDSVRIDVPVNNGRPKRASMKVSI